MLKELLPQETNAWPDLASRAAEADAILSYYQDQQSAVSRSNMEQGVLIQNDSPANIYRNPANDFVRRFLNLDELIWTEDNKLMKIISHNM